MEYSEYSESTKVVYQRIEKVDPENASKIIGYLLLKDQGEPEMIRLALGPDNLILSLFNTVRRELQYSLPPPTHAPAASKFTPSITFPWIPPIPHPLPPNSHYIGGNYVLQNQPTVVVVDDRLRSCKLAPICQSFSQGYCKYGGACQFLHIFRIQNGCFMVLNPDPEEQVVSIRQLEMELIGLLMSRRGVPVSVSSLPIFYYHKYGRALPVEGYLVEGKVRFTLVQLVAQMTKGIHVVDGPHGRQSIILVEDIPRWMEEKKESEPVSWCQVYLTFPPHTMFREEHVYNYFNINFGAVQEVRLPKQEKRMFGFVTFVYPETVTLVLTKTNPHFIGGAKVVAKPYRRKPLVVDRKAEKVEKDDPLHSPNY